MTENKDLEIRIRATKDFLNGVMAQKSTRLIFGGMTLASDVFFKLNMKYNKLLSFLYKQQREYNVPLNLNDFPVNFTETPATLYDIQLIGVLSPIYSDNKGNFNLVSKSDLIIPPVTTNDYNFMAHRYSAAYLIKVVGLPRPSGYRGIKALKEITLKLRFYDDESDVGVKYTPKDETYKLIDFVQDPETKKQYCQFYIHGYERFLELQPELRDRFLLHTRQELKNKNRITDLNFLLKEISAKYGKFELSLVNAARYSQSHYATHSETSDDTEIENLRTKAQSDYLKEALNEWKNRLETINLIKDLLKKLIKSREKHSKTFNEYNLDHLEKLFSSKDEIRKKFDHELLQYVSQGLRETLGQNQSHPYNTEEEVLQKAYFYYREPLNKEDQKSYTDIKRFYHLAEGRMSE